MFSEAKAHHGAGRLAEAERLYRKLVRKAPRHGEAWYALGTLCLQQGDAGAAIEALHRAVRLHPANADGHLNLGHAWMLLDDLEAACASFDRAASLAPEVAETHFALGFAAARRGRPAAAEAAYRRALELRPDYLDALNNLGGVLQLQGRAGAAAQCYRRALEIAPRSPEILANLALVLEMINDLDGARETAERALALAPAHPTMRLLQGQLDFRARRLDQARHRLEGLLADHPPAPIAAEAWHLLGLVHDQAGEADAAFQAAGRGNRIGQDLARASGLDGARYRRYIAACTAYFTAERLAAQPGAPRDPRGPVFFVGFPRSGTTLLEEILAAHPAITTTSERSPLEAARQALAGAAGAPLPDGLELIGEAEFGAARQAYWDQAAAEFGDRLADTLLVDKLPLNIVELGSIGRVLPGAQVIVALRDPRDVCLSCFLQHFSLNDAMANFLDLRATAETYVATMTLWLRYRNDMKLPWLEYRYEDLVAAPEPTLRRIFDFIGQDWRPELLEARRADRDRYVATPSRDAVSQPISARAVGRWRAYAEPLQSVLPILAPWIDYFAYENI